MQYEVWASLTICSLKSFSILLGCDCISWQWLLSVCLFSNKPNGLCVSFLPFVFYKVIQKQSLLFTCLNFFLVAHFKAFPLRRISSCLLVESFLFLLYPLLPGGVWNRPFISFVAVFIS